MTYLETEDLLEYMQERFIDENSQGDPKIIDDLEQTQISIVKTYIGTRYNVNLIFNEINPIANEVLKSIIARFLIYRLVKRNSARKVPTDVKEDYDEALADLKDISIGKTKLDGLPLPSDENGNTIESTSLWGNNTNKNFYI